MHLVFNALSMSPIDDRELYLKGMYHKATVTLKQATDDSKFYFSIEIISGTNDILVDDFYIFNKPDYNDLNQEIRFYQYLKCLTDLTISDIKLTTNYIYLVGPSGIINNRFNEDKIKAEEYQLEYASKFYNNEYVQFLSYLNIILKMHDLNKSESLISFDSPFKPSLFGCTPVNLLTRKYRHGDLKISLKDLPSYKKDYNTIFSCSDEVAKRYNIDNTRRIFAYKALLDYYMVYGREKCQTDFFYDNCLKKIHENNLGFYYTEGV